MNKDTKETNATIEEKLQAIGLDLNKIPKRLLNIERIAYKPLKAYEDNDYKIYKYVNVKDIEILITPVDRLDDLNDKIKKAVPLALYLDSENEETIEYYTSFLNMLKNLDLDKLNEIEEEQANLGNNIPYEIKYKNNYIWQIYYSEIDDKYFMLFSSNENNAEALFYLIKKKLDRKKTEIFVPISHMDYTNKLLKKSEIEDLANYLWFFTKEWPSIYEVYNKKGEPSIEIIGKNPVYDKIKSLYKISLKDKEDAEIKFKLLKALFILASNDDMEYEFKTILNEEGSLDFCYNLQKITYDKLSEFIRQEVEIKSDRLEATYNNNIMIAESLELLNETVRKQREEYLQKERQITNFLECKKSFIGRVKYFFKKSDKDKSLKKSDKREKEILDNADLIENKEIKIEKVERIEKKEQYTIEDLMKVCSILKKEELKLKNMQMDIKALEIRKENFERKIQNATLYINEIESHKKSIFDFWKFTNKDEINMLTEAEIQEQENKNKLKKQFDYEKDLDSFAAKMDNKQRTAFSKVECDAFYAILNDTKSFNILNKDKILKRDTNQLEKNLKKLKEEYLENIDVIQEKDFDIFGNVAEDKTKIKTLKNNKHREIEKDKYKILGITPDTTVDEYRENIDNYRRLINESYGKVVTPYDISVYQVSENEVDENVLDIFDINPEIELASKKDISDKINLIRLNIKENMPVTFYSNIMYYDNINNTLPEGMDISSKVLLDLNKFELNLISRKDFYLNEVESDEKNNIKLVQVYEYDLKIKEK